MAASFKASPFCPPCLTWCNTSLRGRTVHAKRCTWCTCCEATKGHKPQARPWGTVGHKLVPRYPRTHPLTNHLYYGSLRWSQSRSGTLHAPAKTPEGITAYSHVSSVCKASLAISDHTRPHSSTQRPRCWDVCATAMLQRFYSAFVAQGGRPKSQLSLKYSAFFIQNPAKSDYAKS